MINQHHSIHYFHLVSRGRGKVQKGVRGVDKARCGEKKHFFCDFLSINFGFVQEEQ